MNDWLGALMALAVIAVPLALAWIVLARRERQHDAHSHSRFAPKSKR